MFLFVTYHKLQLFSENHHEKQYDFVEFTFLLSGFVIYVAVIHVFSFKYLRWFEIIKVKTPKRISLHQKLIINLQFATVDRSIVLFFAFYYHLSSPWKLRLHLSLTFCRQKKQQGRRRDLLESHSKLHSSDASFFCTKNS